jgi:hypothetical protein
MAADLSTIPPNHPLWESANPRFGTVRTVFTDGKHAARFDDLNSDGREVCLSLHVRHGSDWDLLYEQDDDGIPELGESTGWAWYGGVAIVVGRTRPDGSVKVTLAGDTHEPTADANGWWLFVHAANPPEDLLGAPGSFLRVQTD